jgi:exodeoxyribonuclease VII large subunit
MQPSRRARIADDHQYTGEVRDLFSAPAPTPDEGPITVSELNRQVRSLLERGLSRLWVSGEISNLARPASGHLYFSLKDEGAQIRCAWFRQRQQRPLAALADGARMLVFGRVSLYETRGEYQLIVEQVEAACEGELRRRFEALKRKLAGEGLFDEIRKRPLPPLPERIGVITSPSGAAVRDILTVLRRRFPAVPVVVYPAAVQGEAAVPELVGALRTAARRAECDVLVIGRGGGSLEDLQAFYEEVLARAISASPIPVISAVGHEVDLTIADLVADVRAPTPSGAAELVVPDQREWLRVLASMAVKLAACIRRFQQDNAQTLDWLARRLNQASPARRLQQQAARLGEFRKSLAVAMRLDFSRRGRAVDRLLGRFRQQSPAARIRYDLTRIASLEHGMQRAGAQAVEGARRRLRQAERALNAVSPLATLERGYAIVSEDETGRILVDADGVRPGDRIRAQLAHGVLRATVTDSKP